MNYLSNKTDRLDSQTMIHLWRGAVLTAEDSWPRGCGIESQFDISSSNKTVQSLLRTFRWIAICHWHSHILKLNGVLIPFLLMSTNTFDNEFNASSNENGIYLWSMNAKYELQYELKNIILNKIKIWRQNNNFNTTMK